MSDPKPLVIREVVSLDDPNYFCNKGWTVSFNFNTKSWISFHTYLPNWYIGENNFFYSGLNGGCDLDIIAAEEVPIDCTLVGSAVEQTTTTTTSSTSSTTTTTTTPYVPECNFNGTASQITTTTTTTIAPPPTSYNCIDGNCIEVSGTSGTYATYEECIAVCTPPVTSYNCVDGGCVEISGSSGTYPTLQDCIDNCGVPPVYSYNCVDGNCVQISGSSGTYPTLLACTEACTPPPPTTTTTTTAPPITYNCQHGICVEITDGTGQFASLALCEAACTTSYNCVDGDCVPVSGSSGTYPTLLACQDACTPTTTTTTTEYSCIDKGGCRQWTWTAGEEGGSVTWTDCNGNPASNNLGPNESGGGCMCDTVTPSASGIVIGPTQVGTC